jgi:hypothetical protein
MSDVEKIAIRKLGQLRAIELKEQVPAEYFVAREVDRSADRVNELATAVVIFTLATPVVLALSAWLLKGRHKDRVSFEFERRKPDGTTERGSFNREISSEEAADPKIVEKLAASLNQAFGLVDSPAAGP